MPTLEELKSKSIPIICVDNQKNIINLSMFLDSMEKFYITRGWEYYNYYWESFLKTSTANAITQELIISGIKPTDLYLIRDNSIWVQKSLFYAFLDLYFSLPKSEVKFVLYKGKEEKC